MSDTIEVVPAPHRYFDEDAKSDTALAAESTKDRHGDGLAFAYRQRVERYEHELTEGLRRRWGGPPIERYPQVETALEGGIVTVRFDPALDRTLLRIYVLHGWQGIAAIQNAMEAAASRQYYNALYPWEAVRAFFMFARNTLLLLIRAELVTIERHAANRLRTQLSESTALIEKVLTDLRLEKTTIGPHGVEEIVRMPAYAQSDVALDEYKRTWYRIGNTELAHRLFPVVSRAVDRLDDLRAAEAQMVELQKEVDDGDPLSPESQRLRQGQEDLKVVGTELDNLMNDVAEICPLAILAVPLLTNTDESQTPAERRHAMEHRIGEAVTPLRGQTERILRGIETEAGWLDTVIPDWDFRQPLEEVFEPKLPGFLTDLFDVSDVDLEAGLEASIASLALSRAGSRPEYLPILSERALDGLIEPDGPIQKDSFTYVAWAHYRSALIVALGDEQKRQQLTEEVLGALAKATALLSLALLFTPAGAVVRGVQVALGFGLLLAQTYSVVNTIAMIDRGIGEAIVNLDRLDAQTLSALAELTSMRREYVDQISDALLIELGLIVAAGVFTELKLLLHLRGYYDDLQTLLGE